MMKQAFLLSAILALSACNTVGTVKTVAKTTGAVAKTSGKIVYKTTKASMSAVADNNVAKAPEAKDVNSVTDDQSFGEAVLSPLGDVNLRKRKIPALLSEMKSPYEPVRNKSCNGLHQQIAELNSVLGPDMDIRLYESKDHKDKRKRRETSIGLVGGAAGSFIPFRGIVRAATGATKYEKELRAQYRKGVARRAYLRGIFDTRGC
jgi:hypothetical protein